MPRAIWRGVISFGMVTIPVRMYSATESKDISFHSLHRECHTRVRQVRYCPACEHYIDWGDVERGYEYAKGQFVVLEEGDFAKVPLSSTHTIEISQFVAQQEVDPIYYQRSFYLEPEEVAVKPFNLLKQALARTGRMAVAKVSYQHREHLCCLRPYNGAVLLHTMFYADEIRSTEELTLGQEVKVTPEELDMAVLLIENMSQPFDAAKHHNDYRLALERIIEAKIEGQEIEAPAPARGRVSDLMAALKASVEASARQREQEKAAAERPAAKRAKKAG